MLREAGLADPSGRVWAAEGSTRYLWTIEHIRRACNYVLDEQGPRDEFAVDGGQELA